MKIRKHRGTETLRERTKAEGCRASILLAIKEKSVIAGKDAGSTSSFIFSVPFLVKVLILACRQDRLPVKNLLCVFSEKYCGHEIYAWSENVNIDNADQRC